MSSGSVNSGDKTLEENRLPLPDDVLLTGGLEIQGNGKSSSRDLSSESQSVEFTDVMSRPISFVYPNSPEEITAVSAGIERHQSQTHDQVENALQKIEIIEPVTEYRNSQEYGDFTQVKIGEFSQTFHSSGEFKEAHQNDGATQEELLVKEGDELVELDPEKAEILLAEAAGEEFPEIEIDETEMPAIAPVSLEQFILKEKLEDHDAYHVFRLLMLHGEDPRLWKFLSEKSSSPANFEIFRRNWKKRLVLPPANKLRPLLSPNFVQSLLITGGVREKTKHPRYDYDISVFTYAGEKLGNGKQGEVLHVLYATENTKERKDIFILQAALVKKALPTEAARENFERERLIAMYCENIVKNNSDDPRSKHLLAPFYVGKDKLVMPILRDKNGESKNLNRVAKAGNLNEWAKCLAGAVKGANFASEHGLINSDLKPDNIVNSAEGGVMIDWGGFIRTDDYKNGKITDFTMPNGDLMPLVEGKKSPPFSPNYWSGYLIAKELKGEMSPGTFHKFVFYRILERYLAIERIAAPDKEKDLAANPEKLPFSKLSDQVRLNYPPLELRENVSQGEKLLYELYRKLHRAHHHPYVFRNNDTKQGIDPDFISFGEIVSRLEEISSLPSDRRPTLPPPII